MDAWRACCQCVYVRERVSERERERDITRVRERERERERNLFLKLFCSFLSVILESLQTSLCPLSLLGPQLSLPLSLLPGLLFLLLQFFQELLLQRKQVGDAWVLLQL